MELTILCFLSTAQALKKCLMTKRMYQQSQLIVLQVDPLHQVTSCLLQALPLRMLKSTPNHELLIHEPFSLLILYFMRITIFEMFFYFLFLRKWLKSRLRSLTRRASCKMVQTRPNGTNDSPVKLSFDDKLTGRGLNSDALQRKLKVSYFTSPKIFSSLLSNSFNTRLYTKNCLLSPNLSPKTLISLPLPLLGRT